MSTVTFDASVVASGTGVTSLNWTHTAASDPNLYVIASIATFTASVSAVAFNAVALTQFQGCDIGANPIRAQMFDLVAPNSGANTVSAAMVAATGAIAGSLTYKNVSQGGPRGHTSVVTANTTTVNNLSFTVSSTTGNVVFIAAYTPNTNTFTAGAAATERMSGIGNTVVRLHGWEFAGAAVVDISVSCTTASKFGILAIDISSTAVSSVAASGGLWKNLIGVGT